MKRIRRFQRFMIAALIAVNVLLYLVRSETTVLAAVTISALTGAFVYFSLTFVSLIKKRNASMRNLKKETYQTK